MSLRAVSQSSSGGGAVDSVNGQTGVVVLDIDDIGGVVADGVTITGDGTSGDPLVAVSGGGSVQTVSIVSANGFAGTSDADPTDPALTISTTITGIVKGNGTALSAASAGTDYVTADSTNTFTNKTFDADGTGNSITNIENADIKAAAAIAVTKLAALTASRAAVTDGSGFLAAATTTATEIGYVNGVTSAIQTQLNGKQATGNYITALTGDVTASGPGSVASTLATVNADVGSFTNANITVNAKGLITAASNGSAGGAVAFNDITSGTNTTAAMVVDTGASIGVSGSGTVTATSVVAVDAGGDTTTFPLLAGAATGSTNPLTDGGLTYNATTNALTATTFVGALSGNATTATAATTVTVANEASDTTCFLLFSTAATGDLGPKSNTGLLYNSSTNVITATTFTGTLSGSVTGAASVTGGSGLAIRTGTGAGNTMTLQARDVDGAAYTTFITLTANNTPTCALNNVTSNTNFNPTTNDAGALGTTSLGWADLHGATGFTWNIANGNWVATHSSGIMTVSTGDLRVTTAGTNTASVVTVGGTQTLTAKTLTSPTINGTAVINGELRTDATPGTDDTITGPTTNTLNAGATIAQWELVYMGATFEWLLADASAASTSGPVMLALAGASGTDGNPMLVALPGSFCRNDAWNWSVGAIYVSETTGAITQTAPTTAGSIVRVVGYAVSADVLYFMPSGAWVEVA